MITLTPMSEQDYSIYLAQAIEGYAQDHVKAGNWTPEEALERSRSEFAGYLPQGVQTPNNFVFTLLNEAGEKVGYLWYAIAPSRPHKGFIYDFEIYEQFRRHGYGSEALKALEKDARDRGLVAIELHVFGHNSAARALYTKMGFEETNVMMTKHLS